MVRKLRLIVAVGGGLPVIAAASITCGGGTIIPTTDSQAADAADEDPVLDDASEIDSAVVDTGPPPICFQGTETYIVEIPPAGVPADPGQICAVAMGPVASNTAARVTLTKYSPMTEMASGYIAVPNALKPIGIPSVTVTNANDPNLYGMKITAPVPVAGGYTFQASWPKPLAHQTGIHMTVRVSFSIACEGGSQTVESLTNVHMCVESNNQSFEWVSSGDPCTVCAQICCEMAPSPIVSDNRGDDLPLGRVIQLRLRELARIGRSVVLLAENDGGNDLEYEWEATAGTIQKLEKDVVVWTVPDDGQPVVQSAVWNESGAAVASFGWGVS